MNRFNWPRLAMAGVLVAEGVMGSIVASQRTAASMAQAANALLESLTPEQRKTIALPLDSSDRTRWNFVPTSMFPRQGLPLKDMSETQRQRAHDLLRAGLSQRGYTTTTTVMNDLEAILRDTEAAARQRAGGGGRGGQVRDPELYFFTVFGTPGQKQPWGWRVEGHHVSLHFTVSGGNAVVAAPTFWGSNPAEVREGPHKGLRALDKEQDLARAMVMALDEAQRKTAILSDTAPNDIITMTAVSVEPLTPPGVASSAMTPKQRELLMQLIDTYAAQMTADIAAERLAAIKKAGVEKITFAWAGSVEPNERHYYRVQGPTFLIEFDNTQNNANHIHSVWRDFANDFGRDLLREHLVAVAH
jgi:hypothetical protein